MTKSGRDRPIYRGQGSIAYTAAARTVHLVGQNPDKLEERVVVTIKNNLAPLAPALAFELRDGRFSWLGETAVTAEQLLAPTAGDEGGALAKAEDFLCQVLKEGSLASLSVRKEAEEAGLAWRTVLRAKAKLGVVARRVGQDGKHGGGTWYWELPIKSAKSDGGGFGILNPDGPWGEV